MLLQRDSRSCSQKNTLMNTLLMITCLKLHNVYCSLGQPDSIILTSLMANMSTCHCVTLKIWADRGPLTYRPLDLQTR